MGYIEDLRKIVGHRPLILTGAGMMIFNQNGELLLLRRTDNLTWCFPGGMMEPGETIEETAIREVFEETGLRITEMTLYKIFSGRDHYYRYPNGDETFNISVIYLADKPEGQSIITNEEHLAFNFFSLDALPCEIHPSIMKKIDDYKKCNHGYE